MKLKTVIVIYPTEPGEKPVARKYRRVSSLEKLAKWLAAHNAGHWQYMNTYNPKTKQFVERIYQ